MRLFRSSTYDFRAMERDPSYFEEAASLIFQRYQKRPIFPPWVGPAVVCQARNLCLALLNPRMTWEADAQTLSTSQFWSKLRDLRGSNISILLYLRKLCLLSDGSAMSVEGFNSKLNHIMFDPHRRGLGSDPLEDTLRVVQNGCDASKFDGMTVAPLWREVFGHQWVKSVAGKLESMARSCKDRARKRRRYKEQEEYKNIKKASATNRYFRKKLVLMMGRGLTQRPVRKSLKKRREELRTASGSNQHVNFSLVIS